MKKAVITTSWDDGSSFDPKLKNLLKRYNIPATFYIPIKNVERECMNASQIREVARDFDIGGHTYHHISLTKVPLKVAEKEILEGKIELERIIGRELTLFCYPHGAYNSKIIKLVKGIGFRGARTAHLFRTEIKNAFKIGATVHVHDHPKTDYLRELIHTRNRKLFCFFINNLSNNYSLSWYRIARITLDYVMKFGGVWHLRGHSWEVQEEGQWSELEEIFKVIERFAEIRNVILMDNSRLVHEYS